MMDRKSIVITICSLVVGFIIGYLSHKSVPPQVITKTETKVEYRDTTVYVTKHYQMPSVPKLIFFPADTVVRDNIVYIKDSTSTYSFKEEDYDLEIDAVKLTDYRLDIHLKENVNVPTTITNTTTTKVKNQSKISMGVTFGGGVTYDVITKNVAVGPTVALGVNVRF